MPLLKIDISVGEIQQRCILCGATNRVSIAGLVLGAGIGTRPNPDAIVLPSCPTCGAQEILQRNWDRTPVEYRGSAHCEQRCAVNALSQLLKRTGQQAPAAQTIQNAETGDPPELMDIADVVTVLVVDGVPGAAEWNGSVTLARKNTPPRMTFG